MNLGSDFVPFFNKVTCTNSRFLGQPHFYASVFKLKAFLKTAYAMSYDLFTLSNSRRPIFDHVKLGIFICMIEKHDVYNIEFVKDISKMK